MISFEYLNMAGHHVDKNPTLLLFLGLSLEKKHGFSILEHYFGPLYLLPPICD